MENVAGNKLQSINCVYIHYCKIINFMIYAIPFMVCTWILGHINGVKPLLQQAQHF